MLFIFIFVCQAAAVWPLSSTPTDQSLSGAKDCDEFFDHCKSGCRSNWSAVCSGKVGAWSDDTKCDCDNWKSQSSQLFPPQFQASQFRSAETQVASIDDQTSQVISVADDCPQFFHVCEENCSGQWTASCGGGPGAWTTYTKCICPGDEWRPVKRRPGRHQRVAPVVIESKKLSSSRQAKPVFRERGQVQLDMFEWDMLRYHNVHRRRMFRVPLVYDTRVARDAQNWADKLAKWNNFKRSDTILYKENLFYTSNLNIEEIVDIWNAQSNNPASSANSRTMGCGQATTRDHSQKTIVVCYYRAGFTRL